MYILSLQTEATVDGCSDLAGYSRELKLQAQSDLV